MRCCRVLRTRQVDPVAYRCLLQALRRCGVAYEHVLPDATPSVLSSGAAASFLPLFATQFHFHQHQLTTLGDALVDRYLSAAVLQYCTRRGAVLTTNAAGELNAVLHNHFTLRLFAKELQFEAMAMSPEHHLDGAGGSLDFLEPERASVRRQDVAGTSHHVALLPCGQSPLGWRFSQFIGAVHQTLGNDAVTRVLNHVYALQDEPTVPRRATQLLLRVLEHYPAMSVAEAVLAAQGLAVHYTAKSRLLPDDTAAPSASPNSSEKHASTSGGGDADPRDGDLSIVTGFDVARAAQRDVTLEALASGAVGAPHLASGPGLVDAVDVWRRRTAALVSKQLEPAAEAAALLTTASGRDDGWLSPRERAAYERGPAFAGWVDFSLCPTYADLYGPAQPENGRMVRRTKFKRHVRDPRFYDTLSDARNGVPFDTNGASVGDYLDAFSQPHRRLFEVTMLAGSGGEMRLVGRAISSRYTTARESAARAFLGGVLRDVVALEGGAGESSQEVSSA